MDTFLNAFICLVVACYLCCMLLLIVISVIHLNQSVNVVEGYSRGNPLQFVAENMIKRDVWRVLLSM